MKRYTPRIAIRSYCRAAAAAVAAAAAAARFYGFSIDTFCTGTTCTVETIFDQSPESNHIVTAPAGGAHRSPDKGVDATREKLTVGGSAGR